MEVEMKIRGLMMDPVTNMPIVILKDVNGNTVLPIWVGVYEANAIALEIEKVSTPRPMTHDLISNLLLGLNTGVRKVVVSELKDDTFYAVIWLDRDGELISVDSRPSDALALALRLDCPIYVEETVLKIVETGRHRVRQGEQRGTAALARRPERRGPGPLQDVSRLEDCGIRKMVEGPAVSLYVRGNCVAAVGGTQGSTGLMTDHGLAYLVWRDGVALSRIQRHRNPRDPGTGGGDPPFYRRSQERAHYMTIDEQLTYLRKGMAEIIREEDLQRAPRPERQDRTPAARQSRLRPDRARPAPRPHRAAAQDEALSGSGPHRHLPDRRHDRPHRRPHRPQRHAPAARPRRPSIATPKPTSSRSSKSSIPKKPRSASTATGSRR